MDYLYHGSNKLITDKLIPHKSFHYKPYVYATTDRFYALVRAGKFEPDKFLLKEDYDGEKITLVELQENAFEEVFDTEGYTYFVDEKLFIHDDTCMPNEYVSTSSCPIEHVIHIDNVLKRIKEHPSHFNLISYKDSGEYWKTVRGGKEGYLQRRKERLEKLKM